jgi:hypothetical protein
MTRSLILVLLAALAVGCENGASTTTPAKCSSSDAWSGGEGMTMAPGQACITCHESGEGPKFQIAGTVMGAQNDDDNCNGVSGVTVEITGADGSKVTLTSNSAGNFSSGDHNSATVTFPYTVKISANGKTNEMTTPQSDGDCNSCHTAAGANGAPGRIYLP